jgi:CRISPR-associated endonuclease/helicase Cas3
MLASGSHDLEAYLAAAHHGRVRMSIRSMPDEVETDVRLARGIREGDELLACDLGAGPTAAVALTLKFMELGNDSWSDRMTRLLERHGPFRLAYLEMLVRAADESASEKARLRADNS